ncbi:FRIGIDA-like protein 5 [Linum perenne]
MEKMMNDFQLAEGKHATLHNLMNDVQSKSSSILALTLQWKDLDLKYKSIREALHKWAQELAVQGTEMEEARRKVELQEIEVQVKLEAAQEFLDRVAQKEGEMGLLDSKLDLKENELQRMEIDLVFVKHKIEERESDLERKEIEKGVLDRSLAEIHKQICEREREMVSAQKKCNAERETTEKQLSSIAEEVQGKQQLLDFINNALEINRVNISDKETELSSLEKEAQNAVTLVADLNAELEEKRKELDEVKNLINKTNAEHELKEKELGVLQDKTQLCCTEQLVSREKFIGERVVELEAKEKQRSNMLDGQRNKQQPESEKNIVGAIVCGSSSPDSRLYEPSQPCLTDLEVSNALYLSSDPAGMVFNLLKKSFSRPGVVDETVVRSRVFWLEQLMVVSRTVNPEVKEAAIELAVTWRGKLAREGPCCSMDQLAFLLFLVAFGISSCFKADELIEIVSMIVHCERAPELCRYLGLGKNIPELIMSLRKKNMHMEAIRFSVAFNMVKDFPPDTILSDHLKKARIFEDGKELLESQHQALNNHLDTLKALSQDVARLGHNPSFIVNEMSHHLEDLEIRVGKKRSCLIAAGHVIKNPRIRGGRPCHLSGANATVSAGHNWAWQQGNFSGEEPRFKRQ